MKKWPIILSFILSYFIFSLLLNSIGAVILQVIHQYGVSKQQAGLLEGFKDLPLALVSFFIASSLPRLGYKKAMQAGLILTMVTCACMPLFPFFITAKVLFFTVGVSFALIKISIYASIGLLTKNSREHVSLLNLLEGFFMAGVLAGFWLFSLFINDHYPQSNQWLTVYGGISGFCALNLILLSRISFPEPDASSITDHVHDFKAMLQLFKLPLVLVFIACSFLYVLLEQSFSTWLPTFNREVLQFPNALSVQAASIFAVSLVIGRFLTSLLLQRIHWFALLSFCLFSIGLLIVLTLQLTKGIQPGTVMTWRTAPLAVFLLPVTGLFLAPIYPAINAIMLSALPKKKQAAMTGLIMFFSALGGTTGSLLTGSIFAVLGGRMAFYLLLCPLVLLFFSFYRFRDLSQG